MAAISSIHRRWLNWVFVTIPSAGRAPRRADKFVPQLPARRAAFIALQLWQREGGRADAIISELLSQEKMTTAERGFALELFYGVLRNLTLLDFWIGCLRPSALDVNLRHILRLGLYQLLLLGTPEHAAVFETVELARGKGRSVINGILRTTARQREELQRRVQTQPLSVRQSHPDFLVSRWQQHFGAEATVVLCKWNNEPPPIYARINQVKISVEQFMHRYPDAERSRHGAEFVQFPALPMETLNRGHCYIQDPSTALACRLLDPQPGEKILDACAAPGGKTTYLAGMMQNQGLIIACDRDEKRLAILQENVARMDAKIVQAFEQDWRKATVSKKIESIAPFDRILIDAPCTNTGVMRRRVDVRWRLQPDDFNRMQKRQCEILHAVSRLLKPGGILVYSTCSLEPEENEMVVARSVAQHPKMSLLEKNHSLPFRDKCDGAFAARLSAA
jgi:16S rRNA (cytosine967-C5)-methyltransferase